MILRFCVVIPTYNNPTSIDGVVADVLAHCPFPVLIVDDGSEKPVLDLLRSKEAVQALQSGRVRVLRHDKNEGKGWALRQAFGWGIARGFTHMISFDGDGQHLAGEITKVVEVARKNPWDLVIGQRKMHGENVPGASLFGRKFSNFWVAYQTGEPILDSQSGFRSYPLFHIQGMKFRTRRYDFEAEVLIRLMGKGVTLREAEIDVFYPERDKRISHFHKFHDNVRITLVNIVYVVLSLIRSQRKPSQLAIGMGLGVFIGCSPFFGFHTVLVGILAVLFRVNAVAVWVGSQVSIPPLIPVLALAATGVGRKLELGGNDLLHWFWGSLAMGLVLGVVTTLVTWIAAHLAQRVASRKKTNWTGKSRGGALGLGFMRMVIKLCGRHTGYAFLFLIVPYFYLFAPQGRRAFNEFWSILRPQESWLHRQARIVKHFFVFGKVMVDRGLQAATQGKALRANSVGGDQILQPLESLHGLIFLCAHVGGWDLAAAGIKGKGFEKDIHIVQYGNAPPTASRVKWMNASTPNLIFDINEKLSQGKCIGLMGDRPMSDRYELVPFFGRLAPFDVTAYRLAAATGAPLLVTFGLKAEGDVYDFYVDPPWYLKYREGEARELQQLRWLQDYVGRLEKAVMIAPEQWFNFFKFWSSVPALPSGERMIPARNLLIEELTKPV